jgi:hypothetical protein
MVTSSCHKRFGIFSLLDVLELAFLTPPFLGGFSAEVCEISPHNSDFLYIFGRMMVNLHCKWLAYFEKLLCSVCTLFELSALVNEN